MSGPIVLLLVALIALVARIIERNPSTGLAFTLIGIALVVNLLQLGAADAAENSLWRGGFPWWRIAQLAAIAVQVGLFCVLWATFDAYWALALVGLTFGESLIFYSYS